MRQADNVSYCWTLCLQRVTFPIPEIPSQNAQKSGEIQEIWQFCRTEWFKTHKIHPKQEISKLLPTQKGGLYIRELGVVCPLGFFSSVDCSNFEIFP